MLRTLTGIILFSVFPLLPAWALERPYDHSLWDQFVKKTVQETGEIDYKLAAKERPLLTRYLKRAADIEAEELQNWPREEIMALFINVYNAGVIQAVLDHYPVASIQKIPGLWELATLEVAEKK